MRIRRHARMIAIQALYELDLTNHLPATVIEQRIQATDLPSQAVSFVHHLVEGVLRCKNHLDDLIQQSAPEWPIDQMAPIDRNVLRMALFEFGVDGQTPVKVAINEAVELAKTFGSESAPRFINGVLGSLAGQELDISPDPPPPARDAREPSPGVVPER